jgi:hypothetical protein
MLWFIVGLIVIFLAFGAAGVRTALKVAALVAALLLVVVVVYIINHDMSAKAEREAAKKRIAISEIQFEDIRLSLGGFEKLTGRIRNGSSRYVLTGVEMAITVRDCVSGVCDVVGQASHTVMLDVPPGQVRAVDDYVYFSNMPPKRGEYQWDYQIKSVEGRQ